MRVPLSWLADHVDVRVSAADLADRLTFAGLEIEGVQHVGADIAGVLTARVLTVEPHPGADRLQLVRVDADGREYLVVCGATNYVPGDVVPLAAPGAKLPGGFEISRRQVRGVESDGMLASARELGVFDDHGGILILPPDTPVGVDLVEAAGLRDTVLDIKTFPNRGDTMSIRGVAREAAIALGTDLKPLDLSVPETGPSVTTLATVTVKDAQGCPRYAARIVEGVDASRPAPLWMARRLYLYGQRPLGAVVDVTNYLLVDVGQPLHAFDLDRVPDQRVLVRRAHDGEHLRTLDGQDRTLTGDDTLITAGATPLALAGIMGGADSEVGPGTARVLLEAAHFPPEQVRRTMRRLGMGTESGQRWVRGVDPDGVEPTLDRAAALVAALAGGTVARGRLDAGPGMPARPQITLPWARTARRIGAPGDPTFATPHLERVGCTVTTGPGLDELTVIPPSWRFDLERWADLEEEIARLRGYEYLPATLPNTPGGRLTHAQRQRRRVRQLLSGAGLSEIATDPFVGQEDLDHLQLPPDDARRVTLRVANPLNETEPLLRTTLLPTLAAVARRNLDRGRPGVALFEIAPVFLPEVRTGGSDTGSGTPDQTTDGRPGRPSVPRTGHDEPLRLAVLLAGVSTGRWDDPDRTYSFHDAKGAVELLAAMLPVPGLSFRAGADAPLHPGRTAQVLLNDTVLGHVGQLHPRVAEALGLPKETLVLEVDLAPVLDAVPPVQSAPVVFSFPELAFDVAFLVPPGTAAGELEEVLRTAAGPLLTGIELFDAYEGAPLPAGHRNLAYRVTLQAADRTLSDTDATAVRDRMVTQATDVLRAELRTG